MENKKLVMFDFDGVLVNTMDFWFKLNKSTNENFTWETFSNMNDGNFILALDNEEKKGGYRKPKKYEEKYHEELNKTFSIEDILHDAILHLSQNYRLVIVSSVHSKTISVFLEKENLRECFSDILGYDFHTLKSGKINFLLEKYKVKHKDAVLVTDTLGDIKEANESKVYSIGVTWGLHKEDKLKLGNPTKIIDNPLDLVGAIEDVLK